MTSFPSIDSVLEEPLVIGFAGSVASGKSRFLSSLHSALGYDRRGLPIDKQRIRGMPKNERKWASRDRREKGIRRSNATEKADKILVYGRDEGRLYPFELYAPGGHRNSEKLELGIDGLLYFVDLGLAHFVTTLGDKKIFKWGDGYRSLFVEDGEEIAKVIREILAFDCFQFNTFPIDAAKKWAGVESDEVRNLPDLAEFLAGTVERLPNFGLCKEEYSDTKRLNGLTHYGNEALGLVVQSVIDSHAYAEQKLREGVPVVGVLTHKAQAYNTLPRDGEELLSAVERNFNQLIGLFSRYQRLNGIEAADGKLELAGMLIEWHSIEQVHYSERKGEDGETVKVELMVRDKSPMVEVAHCLMAKALEAKGIATKGLRIVTFSEKKSGLTVHYDAVANGLMHS